MSVLTQRTVRKPGLPRLHAASVSLKGHLSAFDIVALDRTIGQLMGESGAGNMPVVVALDGLGPSDEALVNLLVAQLRFQHDRLASAGRSLAIIAPPPPMRDWFANSAALMGLRVFDSWAAIEANLPAIETAPASGAPAAAGLAFRVRRVAGLAYSAQIDMHGVLDASTVFLFDALIAARRSAGDRLFLLVTHELTQIDVAGATALVNLHHSLHAVGGALAMADNTATAAIIREHPEAGPLVALHPYEYQAREFLFSQPLPKLDLSGIVPAIDGLTEPQKQFLRTAKAVPISTSPTEWVLAVRPDDFTAARADEWAEQNPSPMPLLAPTDENSVAMFNAIVAAELQACEMAERMRVTTEDGIVFGAMSSADRARFQTGAVPVGLREEATIEPSPEPKPAVTKAPPSPPRARPEAVPVSSRTTTPLPPPPPLPPAQPMPMMQAPQAEAVPMMMKKSRAVMGPVGAAGAVVGATAGAAAGLVRGIADVAATVAKPKPKKSGAKLASSGKKEIDSLDLVAAPMEKEQTLTRAGGYGSVALSPASEMLGDMLADFDDDITTSAAADAGLADIAAGDTLERKTTVRFYQQMNPMTTVPLLVLLTKAEVKKIVMQHVGQASGEGVAVKAANPFVTIVPRIPGCIVVPDRREVDVRPEHVEAQFFVTPLAAGHYQHARVEIWYEGKIIDTIATPTKVVTQFAARMAAIAGILNPLIFGGLKMLGINIDQSMDSDGVIMTLARDYFNGSLIQLGAAAAGIGAVIAFGFYWKNRPKKADPVTQFMNWEAEEKPA